jgi:hypothetical protein
MDDSEHERRQQHRERPRLRRPAASGAAGGGRRCFDLARVPGVGAAAGFISVLMPACKCLQAREHEATHLRVVLFEHRSVAFRIAVSMSAERDGLRLGANGSGFLRTVDG